MATFIIKIQDARQLVLEKRNEKMDVDAYFINNVCSKSFINNTFFFTHMSNNNNKNNMDQIDKYKYIEIEMYEDIPSKN